MKNEKPPRSLLEFENEVRKLKAIITLIIYGLLFLLLKTFYDRTIDFPKASTVLIITILSFMLVIIVFLFKRLAELHNGTVSIHSELNKGSCSRFASLCERLVVPKILC